MADARFPIGHVTLPATFTPAERRAQIARIAALPQKLFDAVRGLDEEQLDTRYRAGGWTLRQVVHHIADSHVQAYVRHKLTITEDGRLIGSLPLAATSGSSTLTFTVQYGYCREGKGGLCKLQTSRWEVPVTVGGDATDAVLQLKSAAE